MGDFADDLRDMDESIFEDEYNGLSCPECDSTNVGEDQYGQCTCYNCGFQWL